ncbi:MAG TPA: NAD-dependent epimerase/dehydratase family protein [Trebonia sp.]|nr:NAD-dependent epimerase/dehydratase family protein [Trebonia sp.]
MVHAVVTGGAGFVGARLARELLAAGTLEVAGDEARPLSRLTLIDRVAVPADLAADERVRTVLGDLVELFGQVGADGGRADGGGADGGGADGGGALDGADVIFHLAAAVSAECEADFDLGMHANLGATQALLAACRALGTRPVVVYASSLAVFGGSAGHPLPAAIDDQTMPNPQTSYGTQKLIGEHLLADYTRKGFLRGRAVRLMTVSVRPGRPNAAASAFFSGIIREPLNGQRAACPVDPATEVALASPTKAVEALLRAAISSERSWGDRTALTMPALTMTVREMAAALERVAGPEVAGLIDWVPDPAIAAIVTGWPGRVRADRAARLGLTPDPDFDTVIRMYLAERQVATQ